MGLMVDTNVFISFEKSGTPIDFSSWASAEKVYISDSDERRRRRSAFVEAVISGVGVLDVTVAVSRVHAEIYAELAKKGQMIGAHDLIIAATARHHGHSLLTDNVQEFSRVPGLPVIPFTP